MVWTDFNQTETGSELEKVKFKKRITSKTTEWVLINKLQTIFEIGTQISNRRLKGDRFCLNISGTAAFLCLFTV